MKDKFLQATIRWYDFIIQDDDYMAEDCVWEIGKHQSYQYGQDSLDSPDWYFRHPGSIAGKVEGYADTEEGATVLAIEFMERFIREHTAEITE